MSEQGKFAKDPRLRAHAKTWASAVYPTEEGAQKFVDWLLTLDNKRQKEVYAHGYASVRDEYEQEVNYNANTT